jgi:hypothetical protein
MQKHVVFSSPESFIHEEFVETAYTTAQVDEAISAEFRRGIVRDQCSFLNSNTLSIPLTAT